VVVLLHQKKIKKDELDPAFDEQYGEDEREERRLAREAIVQKALESKDRKARAKKKNENQNINGKQILHRQTKKFRYQ